MRDETDTRPERGPEPGFALRRIDGPSPVALPAQPGVGLLVQIAGRGRFECPEAGPIGLGARDALVHDAARPARLAMAEPGARAVEALFHPDYLREVARVELGAMSAAPHAGTSRVLGDPALASLAASMLELGRGDAATLSATARALAARLLGRHILAPRDRGADARLRGVLAHIERHLDGELRLEELAAVAGVSVFHFSRLFARTVGLPPKAHVRARRVARAERLIRQGGMPLAEVAYACGFAHQSHFTAVFRRHTGRTPGELRTLARGNAAEDADL